MHIHRNIRQIIAPKLIWKIRCHRSWRMHFLCTYCIHWMIKQIKFSSHSAGMHFALNLNKIFRLFQSLRHFYYNMCHLPWNYISTARKTGEKNAINLLFKLRPHFHRNKMHFDLFFSRHSSSQFIQSPEWKGFM